MKVQNQILINLEKTELDEATKWKHIAGPRYKHMDQKYESRITLKLFPMLKKYGINMLYKPIEDKPGSQLYLGRDENGKQVAIEFINKYEPGLDNREGKYDMFVKVTYNGHTEDAGVIDLSRKSHVEDAFSLITKTLKNLQSPSEDKEEKEELNNLDDKELNDLANFRSSLSEQEIIELGE